MKHLLHNLQGSVADVFTFIYNEIKLHSYQRPAFRKNNLNSRSNATKKYTCDY
jgi:hypothetical protein